MPWLGWSILLLAALPATVWMAAALYFDFPRPGWRVPLAAVAAVASLGCITLLPLWGAALAWAALFGLVLSWWLSLEPRADRQWAAEVARAPRVSIDGDTIRISDFRNFDYPAAGAPVPRYEERTFDLSRLESLDYFVCHWGGPTVAHGMVSFGFGGDRYLCLSVEARREAGERYSALRSFFRQFELIYVIGDERDLVRLRTAIRKEKVYLYRVRATPERIRRYLLACLRRAESLAVRPEWYNALTSNCTTNLFDLMVKPPRGWGALEVLASGLSPRYLYRLGGFAGHMSYEELKERSLLRDADDIAAGPEFSRRIRASLVLPPNPDAPGSEPPPARSQHGPEA